MVATLIVAGVVVLAIVLVYNTLVVRRNAIDNAFGAVDAYLMMRYDLIPNLVEVVKGYAAHERATLDSVIALRAQARAPGLTTDARVRLDDRIASQMATLIATAEAYPELKASEGFSNLMRSLNEVEERISAARRSFNAAVLDYNNAVDQFPTNVVANAFGFTRRAFFAAGPIERANPKVALAR